MKYLCKLIINLQRKSFNLNDVACRNKDFKTIQMNLVTFRLLIFLILVPTAICVPVDLFVGVWYTLHKDPNATTSITLTGFPVKISSGGFLPTLACVGMRLRTYAAYSAA